MRSRSSRKKRNKDALGIFIILICALALVSGFFFYLSIKKDVTRISNLCKETGADGVVVVLLDKTEPLQEIQQIEIKSLLSEIKNNLPKDNKISIYSIEDDLKEGPELKIEVCNPGNGSDSNVLISNPDLIRKRWMSEYSEKLDKVVKENISTGTKKQSRIIEAIRYLSVAEFLGENRKKIPKKLIIVSDMMQNSEIFSHYKENQSTSKPNFPGILANLNNVEVEIVYVYRQSLAKYQNKSHIEFWQSYIISSGGKLISVKKI
jgi:hypothetical protein